MQRFFSRRTFFLLLLVFQRIIMPRIDRFQPFGRGFFTGAFHCQMAEPAVRLRALPMLDVGRNRHHVSWLQAATIFSGSVKGLRAFASEEPGIGIVDAQALGQPAQNAT